MARPAKLRASAYSGPSSVEIQNAGASAFGGKRKFKMALENAMAHENTSAFKKGAKGRAKGGKGKGAKHRPPGSPRGGQFF